MEKLLASFSPKVLKIERDQEVEGRVVSITGSEVMVDLGTKSEGILNSRDLPGEVRDKLKVGDKITAVVEDIENESGQIILTSRKEKHQPARFQSDDSKYWEDIAKKYQKEEIIKGKVIKVTQFGVFVQLEEGIEGLIHSSKLGPDDNFEAGGEVSVIVTAVDVKRQRISLAPVIISTKGLIYK